MNNNSVINLKYASANSNTSLKSISYNNNYKCLAYCSNNLIYLYSPEKCKTYLTLNEHTDRANSVKWIDNINNKNELIELISIGADSKIIHWINISKNKDIFDYENWKIEKIYKSSDNNNPSINVLDVLFINSIEKYFAIFTSNGILDLFYFDIDLNEFKLFYSLNYSNKLQEAIKLEILNSDFLLLITGGYDCNINIHTVMRVKTINHLLLNNNNQPIIPCQLQLSLLGHTNSIRDIDSITLSKKDNNNSIFFCTCSQDSYIRTWNITELKEKDKTNLIKDSTDKQSSYTIFDEYKSKTSYILKVPIFGKEEEENQFNYYNITLDSVLSGHEDSVSSVQILQPNKDKNELFILSSSFDFTVVIWNYDEKHNIWNKEYTLGEMVGNRHAFYNATYINNTYKEIIAYAFNGAFYYWKMDKDGQFINSLINHGHFGCVNDICWDNTNNILFSCSKDETTRAYIYWKNNDTWHEVNRPQIHGYEINSIVCHSQMPLNNNNYLLCKIISGADEKVIRQFTPPFNIIKFLKELSNIDYIKFKNDNTNEYYEKYYSNIEGSKQALGLMNREVVLENDQMINDENEGDFANFNPDTILTNKTEQVYISKYNYSLPPNEDFLFNNTLWPEENKFYGHGNETFALAINHKGNLLCSGQKAQNEKTSKLFLWNLNNNKIIQKLDGHTLTIIQIDFSKSDEYILSCSRDRSWCIYKKISNNDNINKDSIDTYELFQLFKNAHSRIIWSCSWCFNEEYFITGSRDKFISIWGKENVNDKNSKFTLNFKKDMGCSVTAVEFINNFNNDKNNNETINQLTFTFCCGLENGEIYIYQYDNIKKEIQMLIKFHKYLQHGKAVKRIKSVVEKENINNEIIIRIASCSDDFSVRIFDINYTKLKNYK